MLDRTECYVTSKTLTEVDGTADYDLKADLTLDALSVKSLRWATATMSFYAERVPPQEIEHMRAANTVISLAAYPAAKYAVAGSNLLMVWPTPTSADTITAYYVPRPTVMSSDAHDPSTTTYGGIPAEFHKAIVQYACWQGWDYNNNPAQATRYQQLYELEIKRIRKYVAKHGGPRGRAIFHPTRRRYPHRNDVYPGSYR